MKDYRCKACHKLLAKVNSPSGAKTMIEIKCPKCKVVNKIVILDIIGLVREVAFAQ